MHSLLDTLRRTFQAGVDLVNWFGMVDAKLDRLGRDGEVDLRVSEEVRIQVTPEIMEIILVARNGYTEEEWLQADGPRDQLCVRFGLTRAQVARVLATDTRRRSQSVAEPQTAPPVSLDPVPTVPRPVEVHSAVSVQDSAAPAPGTVKKTRKQAKDVGVITADPSTWPKRAVPPEGLNPIDETDRSIVLQLIRSNSYNESMRLEVMRVRGLTRQQVAKIKAEDTARRRKAA